MTTATIETIEQINLNNRLAIQSTMIPTVRIDMTNENDKECLRQLYDCLEAAQANKADLIELLFAFEQEGFVNVHEDNEPWLAQIVSSDQWTDEVHKLLWDKWDGDFESLNVTANAAMNELKILM